MKKSIEQYLSEKSYQPAFNLIVDQYSERLYWHLRRMLHSHEDADDALQETFVKAWKNLPSFRGDAQVYSWLYRIATNEALAHLRQRKKLKVVDSDTSQWLRADAYFDAEAANAKFERAIARLPDKQRAVFNLKYFEEMKYSEMAVVLDTSVGALKASYHHAVSKIREFLKED